jgi:hypothetical protein
LIVNDEDQRLAIRFGRGISYCVQIDASRFRSNQKSEQSLNHGDAGCQTFLGRSQCPCETDVLRSKHRNSSVSDLPRCHSFVSQTTPPTGRIGNKA